MRQADHSPSEQGEQRGQIGEPSEDIGARVADVQIGQATADYQSWC